MMLLLVLGVATAVLPAYAGADSRDVIRDCAEDGDLDGDYSDEELAQAEEGLPSDIDEYSDCRDVIRQAQGGSDGDGSTGTDPESGGTGGSGSGGGGSFSGDEGSRENGNGSGQGSGASFGDDGAEGNVAGGDESAGGTSTDPASSSADDSGGLSAGAIIALVLIALAALGGGLYLVRDRLPSSITSRLPGFGSRSA